MLVHVKVFTSGVVFRWFPFDVPSHLLYSIWISFVNIATKACDGIRVRLFCNDLCQ